MAVRTADTSNSLRTRGCASKASFELLVLCARDNRILRVRSSRLVRLNLPRQSRQRMSNIAGHQFRGAGKATIFDYPAQNALRAVGAVRARSWKASACFSDRNPVLLLSRVVGSSLTVSSTIPVGLGALAPAQPNRRCSRSGPTPPGGDPSATGISPLRAETARGTRKPGGTFPTSAE